MKNERDNKPARREGLFSSLLFSSLLLILLTATSCQKDDLPEEPAFETTPAKEGMIRLGRKLENPYTVENMREAYANLVSQGVLKAGLVIDATHLYIKVLPVDEQELYDFENHLLQHITEHDMELLEESISGHIYSHPLDYEILEGGYFFYDPQLPPGGITWQYTVVPVGYTMLPIQYQVIDELFLKCDFGLAEKSSRGFDQAFWHLLETEALKLAGDPYAEISEPTLKSTSPWLPSGRITVTDSILLQQIPLHGARVRARRWFTTHVGITQPNGTFQMERSFRRPAHYSIVWERPDWDIRLGNWGQAIFNGPKIRGSWNLEISSGKSLGLATVHRALHRYFYESRLGLRAPLYASLVKTRLKAGYFHDEIWYLDLVGREGIGGYAVPGLNWVTLPHIVVRGRDENGDRLGTDELFALVCHELAHVSHSEGIGRARFMDLWLHWFDTDTRIIPESWADAVEWALTNHEYHTLGNRFNHQGARDYNFHPRNPGMQEWSRFGSKHYTPLFIDLVDDHNQRTRMWGSLMYPNDNVSGFTMEQIENILLQNKVMTLSQLKYLNICLWPTNLQGLPTVRFMS